LKHCAKSGKKDSPRPETAGLTKWLNRARLLVVNAITLEYPDTWLAAMGTDAVHFAQDTKMAAAVKLYEVGRFTSGQAARFAGVTRRDFLLGCRQWGVDSVNWDATELAAEFATPLPPRI